MNETQFATRSTKNIFLHCAISGLFAMLASSLYIIIDGMFVGKYIGSHALAAINIGFPFIMILFAVGDMIGIGSSVKISIALGEGRTKDASGIFSACLYLIVGINAFFSIVGLLFVPKAIDIFISDTALREIIWDYTKIFLYLLPWIAPMYAIDNYLRVCGQAKFSMWLNIIVSLLNIFLDWFFIVYLHWDIQAAALASCICMMFGTLLGLMPFLRKRLTLRLTKPKMPLSLFRDIVHNGSSEFFNNTANSLIATVINAFLLHLGGGTAVAAYGIVIYIDTLLLMAMYGILDSMQPAVSYNVGAGNKDRVKSFFHLCAGTTAAFSIIYLCVMLLFPEQLAQLFLKDEGNDVLALTVHAIQLYAPAYLVLWINMIIGSFLTAMDHAKESLRIMLLRSLILPAICLVLLPQTFGVSGIFSIPAISGFVTCAVALYTWRNVKRRFFS